MPDRMTDHLIPAIVYGVKSSPDDKDSVADQHRQVLAAINREGARRVIGEPFGASALDLRSICDHGAAAFFQDAVAGPLLIFIMRPEDNGNRDRCRLG